MRLLAWNIQQGGGNRIHHIADRIAHRSADVAVLSEYRNHAKGVVLRNRLMQHGYIHQFVTGVDSSLNSVLIASKNICHFRHYLREIQDFPQAIVSAEFEDFILFGMYLPHKKKHILFEFLFDKVISAEKPVILAGDFNTGINYIDQKGDSFWYTEHLKHLIELGFIDAFRFVHADRIDYSWYSNKGNGYRYDHIWFHRDLAGDIRHCDYFHDDRVNKLSDHSPMYLDMVKKKRSNLGSDLA